MEKLSKNWFTEGLIDFEFKKYTLLAYLKKVYREFDKTALYPSLGEVLFHYRNLKDYLDNRNMIINGFPKEISKEDIKQLKLIYKNVLKDQGVIDEVQQISEYGFLQFKKTLEVGAEIYDFAESKLAVEPIGINPLYTNEGYVFTLLPSKNVNIYDYKITFYQNSNEQYRGIMLEYIETKPYTFSNTLENIKIDLVKRYKKLPNPATYVVTSTMEFPYESTFLPIAKRLLIKSITAET